MKWGLDTEAWLVVMACSGITVLAAIAYMQVDQRKNLKLPKSQVQVNWYYKCNTKDLSSLVLQR